ALLLIPGVQINPAEAQAKDIRGGKAEDAVVGYNRLVAAGISPGVLKPFVLLVNGGGGPAKIVAERLSRTPGVAGAMAPPAWRKYVAKPKQRKYALVEAFPDADGAAKSVRGTITRIQKDVVPELNDRFSQGLGPTGEFVSL